MPKLLENLKVMESEAHDAKVHAVVSSIVIAYVFTKHKVNLKAEKSEILLKCLRLPPEEKVCSEFVEIVNQFDQEILRYAKCSNNCRNLRVDSCDKLRRDFRVDLQIQQK